MIKEKEVIGGVIQYDSEDEVIRFIDDHGNTIDVYKKGSEDYKSWLPVLKGK